nr:unnamed protein product [Spirometra erinaceieuropaei]
MALESMAERLPRDEDFNFESSQPSSGSRRRIRVSFFSEEAILCKGSQKEAVFIAAVDAMGTQHSPPDSGICADANFKITKANKRQEGVQAFGELGLHLVGAGHWEAGNGVDTDDVYKFASPKRQAKSPQTIVDALRQAGQSSDDVLPESRPSVFGWPHQNKV